MSTTERALPDNTDPLGGPLIPTSTSDSPDAVTIPDATVRETGSGFPSEAAEKVVRPTKPTGSTAVVRQNQSGIQGNRNTSSIQPTECFDRYQVSQRKGRILVKLPIKRMVHQASSILNGSVSIIHKLSIPISSFRVKR